MEARTQDESSQDAAPAPEPEARNPVDVAEQLYSAPAVRNSRIHIGLPCYGGQISEATFSSIMRFTIRCMKLGMSIAIDTLPNESLITRARNNLVARMMADPKATHIMFIDADIGFPEDALFKLIAHDVDVVAGLYPKKALPISYVVNALKDGEERDGLVEVRHAGTGFLLIKRQVIERLIEKMPEKKFRDNIGFGKAFEPFMYGFFETYIDAQGYYQSEDYYFCDLVRRELGVKVWVDPSIKLAHTGYYVFRESSPAKA